MAPYSAKARSMSRKAWIAIGKAREARTSATLTESEFMRTIMMQYKCDMARIARNYMQLAVMYRQEGKVL
jgi:hypothetical protein